MQILNFTVDSALLRELGEKLVETVHLALIELVKNSYDADATEVQIVFTQNVEGKSEIHVIDNGKGMNFKTLQDYWMRIATNNKENVSVSPIFGRPLTGAKGIGRFSCRRLGGYLKLITSGTENNRSVGFQNEIQYTEVDFPWLEFEPGTDVTKIECRGQTKILQNSSTGTILIIREIADEWNLRGYNWLKRQLSVLSANTGTKREGYVEDPGFTVKILAPDFEGGVRDIREDFMESGWGTLSAYINDDKQIVCDLNALGLGKKSIISNIKLTHLNDVSLKVAIFVDKRDQMRDTSLLSLDSLEKILPEWGGVQVRFRNFRVYPYGDDDWLDIDKDRGLRKASPKNQLLAFAQKLQGVDASRSLLNMMSMRSYMGNVVIGEKAIGFEMKLNREGFVASDAVDELKIFARFAIDWSTILRDYYLRQQSQLQTQKALFEFEDVLHRKIEPIKAVEAAVNYLEREVQLITKTLPEGERIETEKSFLKATEVIKRHNESNKAELLHLRLVASTSTLLLIFSHEVKSLLGLLEDSKNSLNNIRKDVNENSKESLLKIADGFENLKERLKELLGLTSLVGVDYRKARAGNIALKDRVIKVAKVFDLITKKYNIEIRYNDIPNNLVVKNILEAELYSILLNTVSNSIKSVIAGGNQRVINVQASRESGLNKILIMDTGLGIDESNYEEVFIPFISDPTGNLYNKLEQQINPEDSIMVGSGSGLGLGIVKEIILAHEGSIKFINPFEQWKAVLEIKLA
ncbi:ATP-binding protein [Arcicella sp. DC2W]|uniref:histidine kinase n=1 Tax=Arcicella gelida TaxID=2984195 RepID=A0ABU5S2A5_9BACT|nr:ATP-binding protein [Arcicella sp. DC2W]MEA5402599.1 ATP-binding protein [Arcicella sp. DC2W]